MNNHQGIKAEIDARNDSFTVCIELGKALLARKHYASDEVEAELQKICTCMKTEGLFLKLQVTDVWLDPNKRPVLILGKNTNTKIHPLIPKILTKLKKKKLKKENLCISKVQRWTLCFTSKWIFNINWFWDFDKLSCSNLVSLVWF